MAYSGPLPLIINAGGTGVSSTTAYAVLCGGTTSTAALQSIAGVGTSGQVLTSNGAAALPTFQSAAGGSITLTGDTGGGLTASSFTFNANTNAGGSVKFSGSGTTLSLITSDNINNTFIGSSAGNTTLSGTNNTTVGHNSLNAASTADSNTGIGSTNLKLLTGGNSNTACGSAALTNLLTGSSNVAVGFGAGDNYTSTESSNIMIGNTGTVSESNVIRIGTQGSGSGQQATCFIAGITGVTVTGAAVLCSTAGLLGTVVSSQRYKTDIKTLSSGDFLKLRPVAFKYKKQDNDDTHYGMIAEEVEKICPDLVIYNEKKEPESVKYHEMPALLLVEIQRLNAKVEELEKRIK